MHRLINSFDYYANQIPVIFILAVFVSYALYRWWCQVELIPQPDDVLVKLNAYLLNDDKTSRIKKKTIARYLILSQVLAFRLLSKKVAKRFPTMEVVVQSGLMTDQEFKIYDSLLCSSIQWQAPLHWVVNLLTEKVEIQSTSFKKSDESVTTDIGLRSIMEELGKYKDNLQQTFTYEWIKIPLIYTQVAALVVYTYFFLALIGHQTYTQKYDSYVPLLSILQFIFYVGWLKVAENVSHPFGDEDDDLELNVILDRNASVSVNLIDNLRENLPPLTEDELFDREMVCLPYTRESLKRKQHTPKCHVKVETRKVNPGDMLYTETTLVEEPQQRREKTLFGFGKVKQTLKF
uniref:Bestrophin homolog n=1 Tax=Romanomermis culicivorax TaxID=13658 RepID=A0A915HQW4_ROMCU